MSEVINTPPQDEIVKVDQLWNAAIELGINVVTLLEHITVVGKKGDNIQSVGDRFALTLCRVAPEADKVFGDVTSQDVENFYKIKSLLLSAIANAVSE